jgi:hypothetical protein
MHSYRVSALVPALLLTAVTAPAAAATLTAGPGKTYATPCTAIAAAAAGDTVEVSPGTTSYTDSCEINVAGLTVIGAGVQPTIDLSATQHPADYKGIFVVNADNVTLANLELTGANIDVSNGANGAAIRDQASGLTVTDCYIHDNQDGILATAAAAGSSLTVEYTQFAHNGLGAGCDNGGCTHNIYVGTGAGGNFETFTFAFNWSHDIANDLPDKGHLVKTRAMNNYILYNALLGETGHDSIELDIPNGGLSVVVGNIIQKGPNADSNPNLINYGEEGLTNPVTQLYVASNTFVSNYTSSVNFISVASGGTLTAHNNLFNGTGTESTTGSLSADNLASNAPMFVDPTMYDYHLQSGSPAIGQGVPPGSANAFSLTPTYEYVQPIESVARLVGSALDVGAFQLGTVTTGAGQGATITESDGGAPGLPDAGTPPSGDAGGSHTGDAGGTHMGDAGGTHLSDAGGRAGDSGHTLDGGAGTDSGTQHAADGGKGSGTAGRDAGAGSSGSTGGCQVGGGAVSGLWAGLGLMASVVMRRRRRSERDRSAPARAKTGSG